MIWSAPSNVKEVLEDVKLKHHSPRLEKAIFAIAFQDSKAFVGNRFNWGSLNKFSEFNKLWQSENYDYSITICSDIWHDLLDNIQREALIDLHLSRCSMEYEPETVMEGKKKKKVKDEFGRVQYTTTPKFDDQGRPKWKIFPLDLITFADNAKRYGLWCDELSIFGQTVQEQIDE